MREHSSSRFLTKSDTSLPKQQEMKARKFVFKKKRNFTIHVAQTKVLISFAVTAQLICAFVFALTEIRFSNDVAQMIEHIIEILT